MLVKGGLRQMSVPGSASRVKVSDAMFISVVVCEGVEVVDSQRCKEEVRERGLGGRSYILISWEKARSLEVASWVFNWGCKTCPLDQGLPAANVVSP